MFSGPLGSDDKREILIFVGIFVGVGAAFGLLSGGGILLGAVAGGLLVGLVLAVGWLGSIGGRH